VTAGSATRAPYQLKCFKYNSHYWILKLLSEKKHPLRILDVGTADGYLGAILKAQGHFVVGVEWDQALAAKASVHYDRFHVADIEEFEFPYRGEFDVILFADVLEHLRDPTAVLRRSLPCLTSDGEVIISLPNIANFVIRMNLLFGRFEYGERGILDRTHLSFFTLAAVKRLVSECACRIHRMVPTPVPVQLVFPATQHRLFAPMHELHYLLVRLWKTLLAYQFVVCVTPASSL
jgi:2-polyprenyl-3-methyl-5-hydroxy-6-metoxy-1,4-benzoquinol methylase